MTEPNNINVALLLHPSGKLVNNRRVDQLQEDRCCFDPPIPGSEWHRSPSTIRSRIALHDPVPDPADHRDWRRQHGWLIEKAHLFDRVFRPLVAELP